MSRSHFNANFNPVAAYQARGQRYAIFVGAKLTFLLSVAIMATLTLIAPLAGEEGFPLVYRTAMFTLQATGVLMPYLAFESVYWWYRLRREQAAR